MKTLNLTIFLFLAIIVLKAQTTIKDGEEVYGKWTVKGSPYLVLGEAIVPVGQTLIIEPGVEVQFKVGTVFDYRIDGKYNPNFNVGFLRVRGSLIAKGKKNKMIRFTGMSKIGSWGCIVLDNSSGNYFSYCHIDRSNYIRSVTKNDNATGAISFVKSQGIVENCILEMSWSGINFKQGSKPQISNCIVYRNKYGLESNSGSEPTVINTIIWNNDNTFYINDGSTIKISYSLIQDNNETENLTDEGNNIIGKNPNFDKKFRISKDSPCYKAGKDKKNIGVLF